MASIRTVENIAKLVKLTVTTLSLPASRLNIGAAQFNTSALTLNTAVTGAGGVDVTVAAGSLYYVYAVVNGGGNVALIASLNSSLPTGFTQARAVGGFTTNASSQIDQVGEYPGNLAVAGSVSAGGGVTAQDTSNFVYNGNFELWQRGSPTVAIPYNTVKYHADRWFSYYPYEGATSTVTKVSSIGLAGSLYSVRIQRNSGSTFLSVHNIYQSLETSNSVPLAGKTVTLSFYARSGSNFSAASSALQSVVATGTGTDQNYKDYTGAVTNIQSNTISTSWQKFSHTVSIPANATEVTSGFYFQPSGTAGANDYFEVAQVMLNIGTSAAPFRRAGGTIGGELALCQRYFEKSYNVDQVPGSSDLSGTVWFGLSSTIALNYVLPFYVTYKVTKRVAPPVTSIHAYNEQGTIDTVSKSRSGAYGVAADFGNSQGFTLKNSSGSSFVSGDQVEFHWTADAEL